MISTYKLEKCVAGADILSIVIGKFCHGKKLYLIILLEVDKNLEAGFYYTILLFSLTVYLRIKGSRESLLDAKKIA